MKLEVITPVHIGMGSDHKLTSNLDFFNKNSCAYLIEKDKLFEDLSKRSGLIEDYIAKRDLDKFCQENKLNINKYTGAKIATFKCRDIFELIKGGDGNNYIPGSSLKGSFMSAYIKYMYDAIPKLDKPTLDNLPDKKEKASRKLVEDLMATEIAEGKAPNYSFARCLQIPDVYFDKTETKVIKCKVLSLSNENGQAARWKMNKSAFPMEMFYQSFSAGNVSQEFSIKFDEKLFNDETRFKELGFKEKFGDLLDNQIDAINDWTKEFIELEIQFLNPLDIARPIVKFYEKLLSEIKSSKNTIYLRISSGSGWRGMTASLVEEHDEFMKIRKKYKLGKQISNDNYFRIFPKSRRFIVDENNNAAHPMGWIKLKFS